MLTRDEENAARLLDALRKLSGNGAHPLRPANLAERLSPKTGIGLMAMGVAFKQLEREGLLRCAKWQAMPHLPAAMLEVVGEAESEQARIALQDDLAREWGLNEAERDASNQLLRTGMAEAQIRSLVVGLRRLREDQRRLALDRTPAFLVSARYLNGSSKLLNRIGNVARAFGVDPTLFPHPRYLMAAAGPKSRALVLVENPLAFEAAVRVDRDLNLAWACSYGYGFALDQDYGALLAGALDCDPDNVTLLTRRGNPPKVRELFSLPPYFWGDLDPAAFGIYLRLKRRFVGLVLSPLYREMAAVLERSGGHPYDRFSGKEGQERLSMPQGLNAEEQSLFQLCRERGLDQECLTFEAIARAIPLH